MGGWSDTGHSRPYPRMTASSHFSPYRILDTARTVHGISRHYRIDEADKRAGQVERPFVLNRLYNPTANEPEPDSAPIKSCPCNQTQAQKPCRSRDGPFVRLGLTQQNSHQRRCGAVRKHAGSPVSPPDQSCVSRIRSGIAGFGRGLCINFNQPSTERPALPR
jgi:hypothetical protein